jgi:hypothetical protein
MFVYPLKDIHKRGALTGLIQSNGRIITTGGDNTIKEWEASIDLL